MKLVLKLFGTLPAVILFTLLFGMISPAMATRLPADLLDIVQTEFPHSKIRLDGSIETSRGELYLPLMPVSGAEKKKGKARIESSFPDEDNPSVFVCGNGWCFLKVLNKGIARTVVSLIELPAKLQKQVLAGKFPSDLIVPENFVLPQSFKSLVGDVNFRLVSDSTINSPDYGKIHKAVSKSNHGVIFLTSLSSGVITMVDEQTLNKIAEFPTEGTPCNMSWIEGKLYITDEAKSRILLLDPNERRFLGQIDLPPRSAPKGIAPLPNGKLFYVSESIASDIAVIETATQKVLIKTKVAPGPSRIAITPNGNFLIVCNVTCGQVTILSTLNQRVLGTLRVGTVPTCIAISPDSTIAYVSNRMSNTISVIDIMKRMSMGNIETGIGPTGIALSRDGSKLYVVNARENSIAAYDTKTKKQIQSEKLPVDIDFPGNILMMPDGNHMLVASEASDHIGLFNTTTFQFEKQSALGHTNHDIIWVPIN